MAKKEKEAVCFEDTHKNFDRFFDEQPSNDFVEELKKPVHISNNNATCT